MDGQKRVQGLERCRIEDRIAEKQILEARLWFFAFLYHLWKLHDTHNDARRSRIVDGQEKIQGLERCRTEDRITEKQIIEAKLCFFLSSITFGNYMTFKSMFKYIITYISLLVCSKTKYVHINSH